MSIETIKEAAQAETPDDAEDEIAEGEIAEDEPADAEPETAETPIEPPPDVDERALEKEIRRHHRAMEKILGPGVEDMEACATCGGMGLVPDNFAPPPAVLPDPNAVVCPDCNGWGRRETPSLNEQYRLLTCTECNGTGTRDRGALAAIEAQAAMTAQPAPVVPPPPPVWDPATGLYRFPDGTPVPPPPAQPGAPLNTTGLT